MIDRGMIKWAPFNSVVPTKSLVRCLEEEKKMVKMPILSEEQLEDIENSLISAYQRNEEILIEYYLKGRILKKRNYIKEVNSTWKEIILGDNTKIYFKQIVKIC